MLCVTGLSCFFVVAFTKTNQCPHAFRGDTLIDTEIASSRIRYSSTRQSRGIWSMDFAKGILKISNLYVSCILFAKSLKHSLIKSRTEPNALVLCGTNHCKKCSSHIACVLTFVSRHISTNTTISICPLFSTALLGRLPRKRNCHFDLRARIYTYRRNRRFGSPNIT